MITGSLNLVDTHACTFSFPNSLSFYKILSDVASVSELTTDNLVATTQEWVLEAGHGYALTIPL